MDNVNDVTDMPSGPKFKLEDREHVYTGIDMTLDQERPRKVTTELVAPIYADEEHNLTTHHFKEVVMHAEMIRLLQVIKKCPSLIRGISINLFLFAGPCL